VLLSTIAVTLKPSAGRVGGTPTKHSISLDGSRAEDTKAEETCGLWY
jgi:hypothetical protein